MLLMVALLCSRLWLLAVLYYGWWLWDWHGPERGDKVTPGGVGKVWGGPPHVSPPRESGVPIAAPPSPPPRSPSQPLGPELEDVGTLL